MMGHEGFRLDFDSKTLKIPSCMNIEIPISLHAKPHHAAHRAVYSAQHVVIPPRSVVRVPARVQTTLPTDRDYVFEGRHHQAAFYSHLVDANFAWSSPIWDSFPTVPLAALTQLMWAVDSAQHSFCKIPHCAVSWHFQQWGKLTYRNSLLSQILLLSREFPLLDPSRHVRRYHNYHRLERDLMLNVAELKADIDAARHDDVGGRNDGPRSIRREMNIRRSYGRPTDSLRAARPPLGRNPNTRRSRPTTRTLAPKSRSGTAQAWPWFHNACPSRLSNIQQAKDPARTEDNTMGFVTQSFPFTPYGVPSRGDSGLPLCLKLHST
ncbi:hypothetical protein N7530_009326 [Penicillium desertorum]|uniref:Uncharacterized protein n=1 Tax=Penicillium desertorum TaxID=1303715 RepID=A0A9W9WI94_9EURO|nr:hypothetical protein N7530_009326 [Penicillium desertorum]